MPRRIDIKKQDIAPEVRFPELPQGKAPRRGQLATHA